MSLTQTIPEPRVTTVGDFFALLKPRVMSLVVFTGLAGIVAAPGHLHPLTAFTALLCIAVAAGASGALNMAYDSDIDALMSRTATRPIPMGHVAVRGRVGGRPAGFHNLLLCRGLYAGAEAPHAAEHRDRRALWCFASGD